ncbi:hypothetical protein B0I35DRAFT_81582 [Stachybotrys elegans]|uniref:Uncharacterized protein n=1 Tax=Stachybotrys elegans TaxID=80388 RepID=A0A8K0SGP9_9HYPO|nr:hypothetical protein B0I35DRAFT_81582 [Stachybotrys elegans]
MFLPCLRLSLATVRYPFEFCHSDVGLFPGGQIFWGVCYCMDLPAPSKGFRWHHDWEKGPAQPPTISAPKRSTKEEDDPNRLILEQKGGVIPRTRSPPPPSQLGISKLPRAFPNMILGGSW